MLFKRHKKLDKNTIVFTTHKAGSMLLHAVLRDICKKNRIAYYSPNQTGEMKVPFERIFKGEDFIAEHNGCFGALRFFMPSEALKSANIVVHLRDPRDVLTSMFFSYCYMHPGEIEANTGYRKEVAEEGIDKFVLGMSDENFTRYRGEYGTGYNYNEQIGNMVDRYAKYLKDVIPRPNAVLVSYEEMVLDFPSWLGKFLNGFGISDDGRTFEFVMKQHAQEVKPGEENVRSHKRKVTPGDHKEKLKPETIALLNERFGEVLDALGYLSEEYEAKRIPRPKVGKGTLL